MQKPIFAELVRNLEQALQGFWDPEDRHPAEAEDVDRARDVLLAACYEKDNPPDLPRVEALYREIISLRVGREKLRAKIATLEAELSECKEGGAA